MMFGWIILIIVGYYLYKNTDLFSKKTHSNVALELLDARLVKGEIDVEQYVAMKKLLEER